MLPHEVAGQAAIKAVYGATIAYTGAGLIDGSVIAIRSDMRGAPFQGFDGKSNRLSFEIDKVELPDEPDKYDLIVEASGERWSVIDIDDRSDVDAWVLSVEEAAAQ